MGSSGWDKKKRRPGWQLEKAHRGAVQVSPCQVRGKGVEVLTTVIFISSFCPLKKPSGSQRISLNYHKLNHIKFNFTKEKYSTLRSSLGSEVTHFTPRNTCLAHIPGNTKGCQLWLGPRAGKALQLAQALVPTALLLAPYGLAALRG